MRFRLESLDVGEVRGLRCESTSAGDEEGLCIVDRVVVLTGEFDKGLQSVIIVE